MNFRFGIFTLKLYEAKNFMSFGPFGREIRQFEYLVITIDLTGIRCEKISLQQEIPLKYIVNAKF